MSAFTLVSPFHPPLFPKLSHKRVVFEVNDPDMVLEAREASASHQIDLACVWVRSPSHLSELAITSDWRDTPVALQVPGIGRFRDFVRSIEKINRSNVRFYLPAETRAEAADIRILSSLGYHCCAMFGLTGDHDPDWESLQELAVYASYPAVPHGDIDPFAYIARHYDPTTTIDVRAVYFDTPSKFLHVDINGYLSVSRRGMSEKLGLDMRVEHMGSVQNSDAYIQAVNDWKSFFEKPTVCAACEAWRVCMGAFSRPSGNGCKRLFEEVLQAAEHHRDIRTRGVEVWQF
jgi:hypothetical protein